MAEQPNLMEIAVTVINNIISSTARVDMVACDSAGRELDRVKYLTGPGSTIEWDKRVEGMRILKVVAYDVNGRLLFSDDYAEKGGYFPYTIPTGAYIEFTRT